MCSLECALNIGGCECLLDGRLDLQVDFGGPVALPPGHPLFRHSDLGNAGPVGAALLHAADEDGEVLELLHRGLEGLNLRPFWDGGRDGNFEADLFTIV